MEIYRWIDEEGNVHEHRFENGKCLGFFTNGVNRFNYENRELTEQWRKNLIECGFKPLSTN